MDIVNSKENLMYDPLGSHRTPIYACNTTGRSVVLVVLFCCKTEKKMKIFLMSEAQANFQGLKWYNMILNVLILSVIDQLNWKIVVGIVRVFKCF